MIPKIIHFIWFGGNPFPEKVQYCIESWKKYLPDYQFMLWNEEAFDVTTLPFTEQAYMHKKWAFVSDYVRVYALYKYGGWYLDTDIEIVRPLMSLEQYRLVLGTDEEGFLTALMGSEKTHPFWKKMLDYYHNIQFIQSDGSLNMEVNNTYLQKQLLTYGYIIENKYQELAEGIVVFPDDYFHVVSLTTGKRHQTKNTYAIHWHTLLWVSNKTRFIRFVRMKVLAPLLGGNNYNRFAKTMKLLWKIK